MKWSRSAKCSVRGAAAARSAPVFDVASMTSSRFPRAPDANAQGAHPTLQRRGLSTFLGSYGARDTGHIAATGPPYETGGVGETQHSEPRRFGRRGSDTTP